MVRSILHSVLGLLIILSAGGFNIHMHFCHDQLIDVGIFSEAKSCCTLPSSGAGSSCESMTSCSHCQDKSLHLSPLDEFTVTTPVLLHKTDTQITGFVVLAQISANIKQLTQTYPHNYPPQPPPLKIQKRQPLLQVFLI